ncbi:melanization protease 1 [Trichonephila clavipes]|nr:melanization protease 1 [Trichonephila clavipes]
MTSLYTATAFGQGTSCLVPSFFVRFTDVSITGLCAVDKFTRVLLMENTLIEYCPGPINFETALDNAECFFYKDSQVLKEGKVIQVESSKCADDKIDTERIVCARGIKSRQASCTGDSGSGAFMLYKMNYYILGVTSYGHFSCKSDHPDTYTEVYAYMDWIKSIVKNLPTV